MKTILITIITIYLFVFPCRAQWVTTGRNATLYNTGNATTAIIGSTAAGKTNGVLATSQDANGYFDIHAVGSAGTAWGNLVLNSSGGNVGIGTASPTAALQIGNFSSGLPSTQVVIPGAYNFEQLRVGQVGNGNPVPEFVNHTSVSISYGIKFLVDLDHGPPGLRCSELCFANLPNRPVYGFIRKPRNWDEQS